MKLDHGFARGALALVALPLMLAACTVTSGRSGQQAHYAPTAPPPDNAPPGPKSPLNAEGYQLQSARQVVSAPLFLPGSPVRQLVNYQVVNGMAVMEGDILLGPAQSVPLRYAMPRTTPFGVKGAVALSDTSHLWPKGEIPYAIDPSVSPSQSANIQWAIGQVNETELNVRPRSSSDKDYVLFKDTGSDCSSYIGRIGGAQAIQVADCGRGSIIHEMLHAAGFYHEQSRGDRDSYITIVWDEISPAYKSNFEKRDGRGQDIGGYDYGSIMHYSSKAFSKSGKPTIIPKQAGVTIGQREGMSTGDRAAISQLYGSGSSAPPTTAPPTTAPPTTAPPSTTAQPWNGSFAGDYTSDRGNVSCKQSGATVSCQYPGGMLLCTANGPALDCGWSGGGQGRAQFTRQQNGILAGTWGDFFSSNSRGKWDLVPAGSAPPATAPPTDRTAHDRAAHHRTAHDRAAHHRAAHHRAAGGGRRLAVGQLLQHARTHGLHRGRHHADVQLHASSGRERSPRLQQGRERPEPGL